MARGSTVEYKQVADACAELFLDGKNTSFDSVYELIGRRGSAKIVQGCIADWRKEMAQRFVAGRTNPDLPEGLVSEADKVLTVVWRLALEKSDAAYADERVKLEQARGETAQQVAQAQERAATFERETFALQGAVQGLQATLQGHQAEIEALTLRLTETSTLLHARDEQLAQLREDSARLGATLASERRTHEADLQAAAQRQDQALQTERSRSDAVIQREREIAAGERQHLMRQTDELRQTAKATDAALKEQLQAAHQTAEQLRTRAGKAEMEVAFARGKTDSAEAATAEAKAALAFSQSELTRLQRTLAETDTRLGSEAQWNGKGS